MDATQAQLASEVVRTDQRTLNRYQSNRHWRLYEKEWIYRNFPPAGRSWLDFGCGTGEITAQLALLGATRVIGVDISPGLIDMARRQCELDGVVDRVDLCCGEITKLEPQPVDVVICFAVLHHLPDRLHEVISVLRRWLKPRGVLLAVEPVCYLAPLERLRQFSGVPQDPLDPGERKLTEKDLRCVEQAFPWSRRTHFRLLARLERLFPKAGRAFRSIDATLLPLPLARYFAGCVIVACRTE